MQDLGDLLDAPTLAGFSFGLKVFLVGGRYLVLVSLFYLSP